MTNRIPDTTRSLDRPRPALRHGRLLGALGAAGVLLAACGGGDGSSESASIAGCNESLKASFKPDANTSIVLVKAFKAGEPLALAGTTGTPPKAAADMCLVKMVVGPGFADTSPAAPSSSAGIGIEAWLPAKPQWNQRIQNLGGGGWAGGNQASTTLIGNTQAAAAAAAGYVSASTDTGHTIGNGSFAMRQNGSINTTLWQDFAERSLHELAVKTRALTEAFYGQRPEYAYWNGCSTGGRQGYKIAQEHPEDYDGYLVGAPAFNWTRFIVNELYPQVVMQRDLGKSLGAAKLNLVSGAAVSACDVVGGRHLGFVPDPAQCRYDPTRDAKVLCAGVAGNGGVTGASGNAACVNLAEATAINKIWYGQTSDGSVPDPALDNSSGATLAGSQRQLWWGLTRGTSLLGLAGDSPFPISSDMTALALQRSAIATPSFVNATGNGANQWAQLSYGELAGAQAQGVALQAEFGHINTDNPDLGKARALGRKILSYHGLADVLIMPQGSANYYERVAQASGGSDQVNQFNRLFMIPGMGHCSGVGTAQGMEGPAATAGSLPLPADNQLFNTLVDWVERGSAPDAIVLKSSDQSASRPICAHPRKAVYQGSGSPTSAASYLCQ